MAGYIAQGDFDIVHLHDYHVGLVPLYLGDAYLQSGRSISPSTMLRIRVSRRSRAVAIVRSITSICPAKSCFTNISDFFNNLNLLKACMLKVHEIGGKITTVSGDLAGTWGYAAELRESHAQVWARAFPAKARAPRGRVFVPNRHLDLCEKLPIAGITNGMSETNGPEHLPELKAEVLRLLQERRGASSPLFANPVTQREMLARDHTFDAQHLEVKAE